MKEINDYAMIAVYWQCRRHIEAQASERVQWQSWPQTARQIYNEVSGQVYRPIQENLKG